MKRLLCLLFLLLILKSHSQPLTKGKYGDGPDSIAPVGIIKNLTDEQKESAAIIHGASGSLLMLLNDILDFSKIEAGKVSLENINFISINSIFDSSASRCVSNTSA